MDGGELRRACLIGGLKLVLIGKLADHVGKTTEELTHCSISDGSAQVTLPPNVDGNLCCFTPTFPPLENKQRHSSCVFYAIYSNSTVQGVCGQTDGQHYLSALIILLQFSRGRVLEGPFAPR